MRLLSFLTDIENALRQGASAGPSAGWEVSRMVNYHQGVARMSISRAGASSAGQPTNGSILLQSFVLTDGSLCVKANLSWQGSDAQPIVSVYSKPQVDWQAEAERISEAWLKGPMSGFPAAVDAPAS